MQFHGLLIVVILAYVTLLLVVFCYVSVEHRFKRTYQRKRYAEMCATPMVQQLSDDFRFTFGNYVVGSMNKAELKHISFGVFRVVFLLIAGMAPIAAIISDNVDVQKVLNGVTSVSALFLAVLAVEQSATEHRRAGYMIQGLIQEWQTGIGKFTGLNSADAFRLLVSAVKEILDTSETSFVGAGQQGTQMASAPELTPTQVGELFAEDEVYQQPTLRLPSPYPSSVPPAPPVITAPEVIAQPDTVSDYAPITQAADGAIDPKDWAGWQAAKLADDNQYAEITQ